MKSLKAIQETFHKINNYIMNHPEEISAMDELYIDFKVKNFDPSTGEISHFECGRCKKTVDIVDEICRHCGLKFTQRIKSIEINGGLIYESK